MALSKQVTALSCSYIAWKCIVLVFFCPWSTSVNTAACFIASSLCIPKKHLHLWLPATYLGWKHFSCLFISDFMHLFTLANWISNDILPCRGLESQDWYNWATLPQEKIVPARGHFFSLNPIRTLLGTMTKQTYNWCKTQSRNLFKKYIKFDLFGFILSFHHHLVKMIVPFLHVSYSDITSTPECLKEAKDSQKEGRKEERR